MLYVLASIVAKSIHFGRYMLIQHKVDLLVIIAMDGLIYK